MHLRRCELPLNRIAASTDGLTGVQATLDASGGVGRDGEASAREAQMLQEWKAYKKGYQEGINSFNKKPKKGIAYMQVCCFCRGTRLMLLCSRVFIQNSLVCLRVMKICRT